MAVLLPVSFARTANASSASAISAAVWNRAPGLFAIAVSTIASSSRGYPGTATDGSSTSPETIRFIVSKSSLPLNARRRVVSS